MEDRIATILAKETIKGNFFGYLFSRIKRVESKKLSSVGVYYNSSGEYELHYNEETLDKLTDSDILLMLAHEGLHIMGYHLPMYIKLSSEDREKNHLLNIAMDMAVNSQLNFPFNMKLSTGEELNFHHPSDKKLPLKQSCEFYIDALLNEYDEKKKEEENDKSDDENNETGDSDDQDETNDSGENDSSENSKNSDSIDENKKDENNESNQTENSKDSDSGNDNKNEKDESDGSGENSESDEKDLANDEKNSNLDESSSNESSNKSDESSETGGGENDHQNEENELNDSGTFDDHKGWVEQPGKVLDSLNPNSMARNLEEYTKDIVMNVAKSFLKNKGDIPSYLKRFIDELEDPQIPYYKIIQKMVEGSKLAKSKTSYSKINRKRIYAISEDDEFCITPFPGKSMDMTFKIVICIDTSGSFSKNDLMESLSGIKNIIEQDKNAEITVIEIDTEIHKEYSVKKVSDIDFEIEGGGGTTLLPALIRSKQLKSDCTLFFSDGWCEDLNSVDVKLLPKKLIWILTPDGTADYINRTGFVVQLPKK